MAIPGSAMSSFQFTNLLIATLPCIGLHSCFLTYNMATSLTCNKKETLTEWKGAIEWI